MEITEKGLYTEIAAAPGMLVRLRAGGAAFSCGMMLPGMTAADYEEISADAVSAEAAATELRRRYSERVEALVAERYSVQAELALLRQRQAKAGEFAEYDAFVERCKAQARAELGIND